MVATREVGRVKDIVEEVRGDGTRTVEQQLTDLFDKFIIAARIIDPAITASWVGYEIERPKTPSYVAFERGKPLFGIPRDRFPK